MTYFTAIFGRPAPGQLPWADRLHTRAMGGTVMLSHMLIKVLRMAIDGLWVDGRHDGLTLRSGAVP